MDGYSGLQWDMMMSIHLTPPISCHIRSCRMMLSHPTPLCLPAQLSGRAVLAVRGDCSFVSKALFLQHAGAHAAIIVNYEEGECWCCQVAQLAAECEAVQ